MEYLPEHKAQQLTQLAETARANLSKLSDTEVKYDAEGLSLLDEWIDRHLKQYHTTGPELKMIWGAFLGEAIRRKFSGQWGIAPNQHPPLGIICTGQGTKQCFVDVQAQVNRRVKDGIQASLVYYYTMKGIEINMI